MMDQRIKIQDDIEIMRSVADMADRPLLTGGPHLCLRCASPESVRSYKFLYLKAGESD